MCVCVCVCVCVVHRTDSSVNRKSPLQLSKTTTKLTDALVASPLACQPHQVAPVGRLASARGDTSD